MERDHTSSGGVHCVYKIGQGNAAASGGKRDAWDVDKAWCKKSNAHHHQ